MTVLRSLAVRPDPLAIAARLAGRPGLAILVSRPQGALRAEDARYSFVACDPCDRGDAVVPPGPFAPERGFDGTRAGPLWIGAVPYDAVGVARPRGVSSDERLPRLPMRPAWRRYPAVVRIDHATGHVAIEADDDASAHRLASAIRQARGSSPGFSVRLEGPEEDPRTHVERVREALRLIAAGEAYEINLCRRMQLTLRGDALSLFGSLLKIAPAPWGYFQDFGDFLVLGASPELALSVRGKALRTCPIKGTRPRGRDADDDRRAARELDTDPKERAELVMAVDVHRNDLGRVAQVGTVRLLDAPRVVAGLTVWSRVAEVVASRAPGATLADVVDAVLPCGSVTGAPKRRAMEIITALESSRRGAYTGAFGYVGRDGALELAVAIRTIQAGPPTGVEQVRAACYFAGGGIVADSDPERELEETRWKAVQITRLGT
ncbi:MAG TPA: anthranilate synthase component I family protein [Polyangiaceae bacterium]|nr:anthranilate synthase component I family protein [Polyangiaceae bacterium]